MSSTETASSSKTRNFFHFWFPWFVLSLATLAIVLFWTWPAEDWERLKRVNGTEMTVMLSFLLLLFWFLVFSGLRWRVRLGGTLALVLAVLGSVKGVRFTGDMEPIFQFRWERTHDEILEAQRKSMADGVIPPLKVPGDDPADFPEYRGRKRDGVVAGPPLARDWKIQPPKQLWKQPVGGGYAGFAVAGNAAVTIEQRRDEEVVACYDTLTGQERWLRAFPAHFQEALGGPGPRATPTIAEGDVYALGATGRFVCLELSTGRAKWAVDILTDNDNVQWGMSGSPLVYDKVVVVNPGTQRSTAAGRAVVAYDRGTGKQVWTAGSARAGYSSPMLATLAGRRQIVLFDGERVAGYDASDGTELWDYKWSTMYGINVAQPLILPGDRIFISSGYEVGCALLQLSQASGRLSAQPIWPQTPNKNMRCRFTSPVFHKGFIYGLDEGFLCCLDPETGKRRWREGRYGHGQLLLTDDLLLILTEKPGRLVLVQATPDGHHELGRIDVFSDKTWNYLALADGKAYLRNDREMACYDLADKREAHVSVK